ncbi:MAG TPA: hypothetical protein VMF32_17260 [Xanthobacteraceae bacterium]|nr:hypothetical protein [Xanthobacteraceae bacterium]
MFQPRSSEFDPRVSAIVEHLRAIEAELGAIGKIAGRRASSGASATANQIVDAIVPILNDLTNRLRRGQQTALAEAKGVGAEAVKAGVRAGNDALDRLGDQAKQRPLFTMAVTLGIGMLIGFATQWDWND